MNNYCIKDITDYKGQQRDLYICDGFITETPDSSRSFTVIEGKGKIAYPSFIDLHTHLDKTFTKDCISSPAESLIDAIVKSTKYMSEAPEEDFVLRAQKMADLCLANGTGFIRTHITLSPELQLKAWDTALRFKKELTHPLEIQLVMFPGDMQRADLSDPVYSLVHQAIQKGGRILGGCPTLSADYRNYTDILFETALKYDLLLDLHVDESDEPSARALEYIAEKTIETGMQGKVTAGHCTSLNALPPEEAARVIEKVRQAGIHIVTLPSCNLFLMGRNDALKQRRGTTRINEFLQAGVNISLSSDNIRDPFRPFGRGDLMEEALLTAQLTQRGTPSQLRPLSEMITDNPAMALRLENYGLTAGSEANLVLIEGESPEEALINQGEKTHIFLKGKLIMERETRLIRY